MVCGSINNYMRHLCAKGLLDSNFNNTVIDKISHFQEIAPILHIHKIVTFQYNCSFLDKLLLSYTCIRYIRIVQSQYIQKWFCLKDIKLEEDEYLISHDVVSLFTNTPVDLTLDIIRKLLEQDSNLNKRTRLTVDDIIELFEFILTTTYFTSKGTIY